MNIFARARPSIARASARVGPGLATPLYEITDCPRLTVDMGQAGNSPGRDQSGKKCPDLGYASSQLSPCKIFRVESACVLHG